MFVWVSLGFVWVSFESPMGMHPNTQKHHPHILCWAEHSAEAKVVGLVSTGGTEAVVMQQT